MGSEPLDHRYLAGIAHGGRQWVARKLGEGGLEVKGLTLPSRWSTCESEREEAIPHLFPELRKKKADAGMICNMRLCILGCDCQPHRENAKKYRSRWRRENSVPAKWGRRTDMQGSLLQHNRPHNYSLQTYERRKGVSTRI